MPIPNLNNLQNSQNAGLRPAMLAIAVSGSSEILDFFHKFVLFRFHGRYLCRYTDRWFCRRHLTTKWECYVMKRFLSENSGFLPGIRNFPEFFCTMSPGLISGFRKTKLYKNPLRIVGGDSKHRNLFSNITHYTHTIVHNLQIYILIIRPAS